MPAVVLAEADCVVKSYTSDASYNKIWLADITGHATVLTDGKLSLLQHA